MQGFRARFRRLALMALGAAILMVGGCATVDPAMVRTQTAGKSLAVASLLGPLNMIWIGTTVFNNEYGERSVAPWGVDDIARETAATALDGSRRFSTVVALKGVARERDEMPKMPAGAQADYLLLIDGYSTSPPDPIWHTKQSFAGLGIAQHTVMGTLVQTRAYVALRVTLFDARSAAPLGTVSKFVHWPLDFHLRSGGNMSLTGSYPRPVLDDADMERLREPMLNKVREMVSERLSELGLL